jgi:hypothetical protein
MHGWSLFFKGLKVMIRISDVLGSFSVRLSAFLTKVSCGSSQFLQANLGPQRKCTQFGSALPKASFRRESIVVALDFVVPNDL